MHGQIVRAGLPHGRRHDFYDPEGKRHFRNFVQHAGEASVLRIAQVLPFRSSLCPAGARAARAFGRDSEVEPTEVGHSWIEHWEFPTWNSPSPAVADGIARIMASLRTRVPGGN
jgi:hypothetical protein